MDSDEAFAEGGESFAGYCTMVMQSNLRPGADQEKSVVEGACRLYSL